MIPHGNPGSALALALAALLLSACAGTAREQPTAEQLETVAVQAQEEYVIGPRDVLTIVVWKEQDLSVPRAEVRLDGKISVPLIDDVQAAGKTPLQLKQELTERLHEYVTAPMVTVIVASVGSKLVYIIGEVTREGPVNMQPDMRVLDAISLAGGLNPFAGKSRIKIIRSQGTAPAEFTFDYDRFVDGRDLAQNILLIPGDTIVVPEERPFWR
ncbi:MAG: polysaccharide biosynthesis/export family protein [Myxococcota bacterium]